MVACDVVFEPCDVNAVAEDLSAAIAAAEAMEEDVDEAEQFAPISAIESAGGQIEQRSINIPPHRFSPLRKHWMEIYTPIVEHLHLQIRINLKKKSVQLRTCPETSDSGAIQKAADFVRAFMLGFEIRDAIALLRLDDLYIDSFEVKDGRCRCVLRVERSTDSVYSENAARRSPIASDRARCWSGRKDEVHD